MNGLRCQVLLQAVLGLDGNHQNVVDRDVLDDEAEDNSENIHDLEMMDDHGKEVTVGITNIESWLMKSLTQNEAERSCGNLSVLSERRVAELRILLELAGSALHSRRCLDHHHHPQPRHWEL